jgi:hypothetical protein
LRWLADDEAAADPCGDAAADPAVESIAVNRVG